VPAEPTAPRRGLLAVMVALALVAAEQLERAGWTSGILFALTLTLAAVALAPLAARHAAVAGRNLAIAATLATFAGAARHFFEPSGRVAPLDVLLLSAATLLMPTLLVFSFRERIEPLLAAIAAVVLIVSTSFASDPRVQWLVPPFLAAGSAWLFARTHGHGWRGLAAPATLAVAVVLLLAMVAGGSMQQTLRTSALSGFLPGSGGSGEASDSARGGVGNGIDEIAGDDAASAGYDAGDRFAETGGDALYDLWIESFGAPIADTQGEKMIGLRPDQGRVVTATDRQDLRSGRAFELRRRAPHRAPDALAADARALLFVEGRAPLHLRLRVFDHFDGHAWHPVAGKDANASLERPRADGWITLIDHPGCSSFGEIERHRLKLAALRTDVLPMPPASREVKFGRGVDRSFFREKPGGLLATRRAALPAGSVIEVASHAIDLPLRDAAELSPPRPPSQAPLDETLLRQVRGWIAGIPPGWPQVERIVERVRASAPYSPDAATETGDPIAALLSGSAPGNSYHFASATTLALQSVGYSARLVSGIHVCPDRFDASTAQTPVTSDDLHFWVELKLPSGAWLPLEPTPGFALRSSPATPWQRLVDAVASAGGVARANALPLTLGLLGLAGLAWQRRRVCDEIDLLGWRVRTTLLDDDPARSAARLLERHARRWGRPRPADVSPPRWIRQFSRGGIERDAFALALAERLEHSLYRAPAAAPPRDDADVTGWLQALRTLVRSRRVSADQPGTTP
jgi:hypothetical protein